MMWEALYISNIYVQNTSDRSCPNEMSLKFKFANFSKNLKISNFSQLIYQILSGTADFKMKLHLNIYFLVCLSVCVQQASEQLNRSGVNFFVTLATDMIPGKVYEWSKFKNFTQKKIRHLKFSNMLQFLQKNPLKCQLIAEYDDKWQHEKQNIYQKRDAKHLKGLFILNCLLIFFFTREIERNCPNEKQCNTISVIPKTMSLGRKYHNWSAIGDFCTALEGGH